MWGMGGNKNTGYPVWDYMLLKECSAQNARTVFQSNQLNVIDIARNTGEQLLVWTKKDHGGYFCRPETARSFSFPENIREVSWGWGASIFRAETLKRHTVLFIFSCQPVSKISKTSVVLSKLACVCVCVHVCAYAHTCAWNIMKQSQGWWYLNKFNSTVWPAFFNPCCLGPFAFILASRLSSCYYYHFHIGIFNLYIFLLLHSFIYTQ